MDLPFLANLSNIDALILVGAAVLFLVLAYMIFKQLMKALVIGIISAAIPIVLYLMGFNVDVSFQTVIWFGLAGIATYFIYDVVMGWFKLASMLTWPIRKLFRSGGGKKAKPEKPNQKEEKKSKEKEKDERKEQKEDKEEKQED